MPPEKEVAIEMVNISKVYPDGVLALDKVSLTIYKGEIHGILGENGAGKTTLMRILYGNIKPTGGKIKVFGKEVSFGSSKDAIKIGIGMVHQHPSLVPVFTALENIYLGLPSNFKEQASLKELIERTGIKVPLEERIEDVSLGIAQKVEILKVLYRGAEILILDEPTTNMTVEEVREFFSTLRNLKKMGKTVIFISHKLKEVLDITDNITVLRRGKVSGSLPTSQATPEELAKLMVGREVFLKLEKQESRPGEKILRVEDLWVKRNDGSWAVKGVSFEVRYGEIFGIAGVEGNGQSELIEAIAGLRRAERGKVFFKGENATNVHPLKLYTMGLAHIPEDRQKTGLILDMSVAENSILGIHRKRDFLRPMMIFNENKIKEHVERLIQQYEIVVSKINAPARSLSGGNQQKVVVGREFSKTPDLIIASQPTRGLDVGATEYIRSLLLKMRNNGKAVLLMSSDIDEIMGLSDRVAVIYEGEFMGISETSSVSEKEIGMMMGGYKMGEIGKK
ncbi:MAG: ATP-binding cassette domain-containing protein [Desulfurococcales archaeon]|jgi:simple sugar transport system ATP-binding protein|nr:ATP-binding cassette domain-containing protein [Desulfurococcales archaeon]